MTRGCTEQDNGEQIVAILLAAGAGRRFGGDKLLKASLNEKPLGLIAAETFGRVLPVYVVTRSGDEALKRLYENAGCDVVVAEQAEKGMGNSLAAGLRHISAMNKVACLVGLADMPLIEEETLRQLSAKMREGAQIVRPVYHGQQGQPVGFNRCHFEHLIDLNADKGARDYLKKHNSLIDFIDVDDIGTVTDIDTPEDLERISAEARYPLTP